MFQRFGFSPLKIMVDLSLPLYYNEVESGPAAGGGKIMRLVTMMQALKKGSATDWKKIPETKWEQIRKDPYYAPHVALMRERAAEKGGKLLECIPYSYFKLFDETGSRTEFQQIYRDHRNAMSVFAMAALIDGTHIDDLENAIWAICDEYSWCLTAHFRYGGTKIPALLNPAPTADNKMKPYLHEQPEMIDLCAAQTAADLAEITTLLEDKLAPIVVYRARKLIRERVLEPFMAINKPFHWETVPMNWASVCGGGVGIAAMYMIDDDDMLAPILTRCTESMECYLSGFKADGVCAEGLGYWSYGLGHFMIYADLLKRRTAGEVDLFAEPITHKVALFHQNAFLNKNNAVCFSDCHAHVMYDCYTTHYLYHIYPDVEIPPQEYANPIMGGGDYFTPVLRNFLWTEPDDKCGPPADADSLYNETQWAISRKTFDTCRVAFAAKGGDNNEPHNHNDLGSFVLDVNGDVLLGDLGGGMYSRQYFSAERYTMLVNGSHGHPVPIIDGKLQVPGEEAAAADYQAEADETAVRVRMELASAYPDAGVSSFVRAFTFTKTGTPTLTIDDTFGWAGEAKPVTERFTTLVEPAVQADGSVLIRGENGAISLRAANGACAWKVTQTEYEEAPENLHQKAWLIDAELTPAAGETVSWVVSVV